MGRPTITRKLLEQYDQRAEFFRDINAVVDRYALEALLEFLLENGVWERVAAAVTGLGKNKEMPRYEKHDPNNIDILLSEVLCLCRFSVVGTVFEQLGRCQSSGAQWIQYKNTEPSNWLLARNDMERFAEALLIHHYQVSPVDQPWYVLPLVHQGQVIGYAFSEVAFGDGDQSVSDEKPQMEFSLYQDHVLEDVMRRYIRQIRPPKVDDRHPLVFLFLFSSQNNAFYLSGLGALRDSTRRWTRKDLERLRDHIKRSINADELAYADQDKLVELTPETADKEEAYRIVELSHHYSDQIARLWEYFFYSKLRNVLPGSSDAQLPNLIKPVTHHIHRALPYQALAVWGVEDDAVRQLDHLLVYRAESGQSNDFELCDLTETESSNLNVPVGEHVSEIEEFWRTGDSTPDLFEVDRDRLLNGLGLSSRNDIRISDPTNTMALVVLRIPLRPDPFDPNVSPAVMEFVFQVGREWYAFADEVSQFIARAFLVAKQSKEQIEMESDAKRGRLARNIRHELAFVLDRMAVEARKIKADDKRAELLRIGTQMATSRLKDITQGGAIVSRNAESHLSASNLLDFVEFIRSFEKPQDTKIHGARGNIEVFCWPNEDQCSRDEWRLRLSLGTLYALWNNLRRNAFDVLRVYCWPEALDYRNDRLASRVENVLKELGSYQERFENKAEKPRPKMLVAVINEVETNTFKFYVLDNAPELSGPKRAVEYHSASTYWNNLGYRGMEELETTLNNAGIRFSFYKARPLSENVASELVSMIEAHDMGDSFDLQDPSKWTLAGFEIQREE